MNKQTFCLLSAAITLSVFSCKKEKKTTPPPAIDSPVVIVYDDYTKLSAGNYWIYQDYKIDSANGAAHAEGTFDSVYVEKDTVINSNTYHKYVDVSFLSSPSSADYHTIYMLRDSLSYMVNSDGRILFSYQDFTNIFRTFIFGPNFATGDTITVTEQMGFKDAVVSVDAGTFVTSTFRQIYHHHNANYPYGNREYDHRYCKNIGLISYTTGFYDNLPYYYERRLVRYHLN